MHRQKPNDHLKKKKKHSKTPKFLKLENFINLKDLCMKCM